VEADVKVRTQVQVHEDRTSVVFRAAGERGTARRATADAASIARWYGEGGSPCHRSEYVVGGGGADDEGMLLVLPGMGSIALGDDDLEPGDLRNNGTSQRRTSALLPSSTYAAVTLPSTWRRPIGVTRWQ
jgi:hypothetical protein